MYMQSNQPYQRVYQQESNVGAGIGLGLAGLGVGAGYHSYQNGLFDGVPDKVQSGFDKAATKMQSGIDKMADKAEGKLQKMVDNNPEAVEAYENMKNRYSNLINNLDPMRSNHQAQKLFMDNVRRFL